jgi:uncharacterized membrane protein
MTATLVRIVAGAVGFMVLDGIWLGFVMKSYYRQQLAPIVRLADGGIAPNWPAAFAVYVLLGAGIAVFAVPRSASPGSAALSGLLLGLVIYGVYDFTNFSTLKDYPLTLALVDWAWGGVATATCTTLVWLFAR